MRNFMDRHLSKVVYVIRLITRYTMIYLGSISAHPRTVVLLLALSLILVAWSMNAPTTLLKPKSYKTEDFRTGDVIAAKALHERIDWPLAKTTFKHLGLGIAMAIGFYGLGLLFFQNGFPF